MIAGGSKKNGIPTSATVLAVEDLGVGEVVTLETSTRTLITEGLCSHNSNVNFSSARMARIAHWANVHEWRWGMLIPRMCDGVWNWVIGMAAGLNGWPSVPRANWVAPPMPILEPDKEGTAYQRLIRNGLVTWPQAVIELGGDPRSQLAEIKQFNEDLDESKVVLDCDPRRVNQVGQVQMVATAGADDPAASSAPTAAAPAAAPADAADDDESDDKGASPAEPVAG